jgi:hypothetical protein
MLCAWLTRMWLALPDCLAESRQTDGLNGCLPHALHTGATRGQVQRARGRPARLWGLLGHFPCRLCRHREDLLYCWRLLCYG